MPTQLALKFDDVPVTCPTQERYHAIAPCLALMTTPAERAASLNIGYSTITRWLREFRENGMRGLFPATGFPREPYTPERVIATLLYFKCCVPKAGDRELARVVTTATGHQLHNETVKVLLQRYFLWQYSEFQKRIQYPVPADPQLRRLEMVKLQKEGWSEKSIASLLNCTPKTINKWLRRYKQEQSSHQQSRSQQWLLDRSHAPLHPQRKVYLGAIHAVLTLQKKYGYAGWFRIKGYLEQDYGIYLSPTTIKKIMALNRRLHLAPQRPAAIVEVRDPREGPKKSYSVLHSE